MENIFKLYQPVIVSEAITPAVLQNIKICALPLESIVTIKARPIHHNPTTT